MFYRSRFLAAYLRDILPRLQEQAEAVGRETVQITIWLVGLAAAFITFLLASPTLLAKLGETHTAAVVSLLSLVVAFGVFHRVVYLLAEHRQRTMWHGLAGHLIGYTSDHGEPPPLETDWSRDDVIRALQDHFELDYGFLATLDASLEQSHAAYRAQYDMWKTSDTSDLEKLGVYVGAYSGMNEASAKGLFLTQEDIAHTRKKGAATSRLHTVAVGLFLTASAAFVAAVLTVAARIVGGTQ